MPSPSEIREIERLQAEMRSLNKELVQLDRLMPSKIVTEKKNELIGKIQTKGRRIIVLIEKE